MISVKMSTEKAKNPNKTEKRRGRLTAAIVLLLLLAVLAAAVIVSGAARRDSSAGEAGERRYQNPPEYIQITDTISTHGYDYYTSPVLVDKNSTKKDHIKAMITTAMEYEGDPFVNRESGEPGKGVDCSGLVMQACYGAGVDLWPSNPYRHKYGDDKYEWESREIAAMDTLKTVPYSERKRGDLIFYENSEGTIIHVAIYLGRNRIIHSSNSEGGVVITPVEYNEKAHVCLVKRIFN